MASFKEDVKSNLKENFRSAVEEKTGIVGQVLKQRREKQEQNQQIEREVSAVEQTTQAIRVTGSTLTHIEVLFTQISKNFQAINKSFNVVVTLQDETNKTLNQQVTVDSSPQQKASINAVAKPATVEEATDNTQSLLDLFNPLDLLDRAKGKGNHEEERKRKREEERKKKQEEERKRKQEEEKRKQKANEDAKKARERIEKEGREQGKSPKQIEKEVRQEAKKIAEKALEKPTPGKVAKLLEKGGKLFGLASKAIAKALPGVGVAAGAVDAGVRFWEGDYRGGALSAFQTALGAAGLFGNAVLPGAASIAAGIAVIAAEVELQKGAIYESVYGEPYPINPTPEEQKAMDLAIQMVKELLVKELKELVKKMVGNSPPAPEMQYDALGNPIGYTSGELTPPPTPPKLPPAPPLPQPTPAAPPPAPVAKPAPAAAVTAAPAPAAPQPAPPSNGSDKETMDMIKKNEGFKNKPYKDSLGKWTVGVGHLIGDGKTLPPAWDRTFTNEEIDTLFAVDFQHHKELAAKSPGWEKANDKAKMGIIDLTFNMGAWYKTFKNAAAAMAAGDFQKAAEELKFKDETKTTLSAWYQQVKGRAERTTALIAAGGAPTTGIQVAQQSTQVASVKTDMKREQQPDINIVKINDVNTKKVAV